jgi:hypothetical protein
VWETLVLAVLKLFHRGGRLYTRRSAIREIDWNEGYGSESGLYFAMCQTYDNEPFLTNLINKFGVSYKL